MASALIHMAVAKKVNEQLKMDEKFFLLGSIAPDIGKELNIPRKISHFKGEDGLPNLELFLKKYKNEINKPYELGYYVHLITDYFWSTEFITNYDKKDIYVLKDGKKVNISREKFNNLIYNDYTNLNRLILDYYNLDLSIFYDEYEFPNTMIDEIPKDKLRLLVDKMGLICSKDYSNTEYILSLENIIHFIEYAAIYVIDKLEEK